jgi:hypothetical protein
MSGSVAPLDAVTAPWNFLGFVGGPPAHQLEHIIDERDRSCHW